MVVDRRGALPDDAVFAEKVCDGCNLLPSQCAFSRCLKEMTPHGNRWGKRAVLQRLLIEELTRQGLSSERIAELSQSNMRTVQRIRAQLGFR